MSSLAEIALNTPRSEPPAPTANQKQKVLPDKYRPIEYNLPTNFNRRFDETHGYHWIYVSPKLTNLTAHLYPDIDRQSIKIVVLEIRGRERPAK